MGATVTQVTAPRLILAANTRNRILSDAIMPLLKHFQERDPEFRCSSLLVTENEMTFDHRDHNLAAPAMMIALGGYKGGELVVSHPLLGDVKVETHNKATRFCTQWKHHNAPYALKDGEKRICGNSFGNLLVIGAVACIMRAIVGNVYI